MCRGSDSGRYAPMSRRTDNASDLEACAFAVPRRLSVRRIVAAVTGKLSTSTHAGQPVHVRYLDTFDRRLRHAGLVLEHVTLPGESLLRYRQARPRRETRRCTRRGPARVRARCLARSPALAALALDRRPAAARGRGVPGSARRCQGLRPRDKTVLVIECFTARRGPARLTVSPLRGYERFAKRAIRRLRVVEGIAPDDGEPMLAASDGPDAKFGAMEIPACANLDPGERSDAACKRLLAVLDAVLEMNTPGIEADLDPECLHDFRVATRKARSLLGEMRRVLPQSVTRRLRADLGWLGQCTGPVRDLDVHLLEFGSAACDGEEGKGNAAAALRDHLAASRTREYRALLRNLRSTRYRRVRRHSGSFSSPSRPRGPGARTRWSPSRPCRRHASSRSIAASLPRAGRSETTARRRRFTTCASRASACGICWSSSGAFIPPGPWSAPSPD